MVGGLSSDLGELGGEGRDICARGPAFFGDVRVDERCHAESTGGRESCLVHPTVQGHVRGRSRQPRRGKCGL
jgi:hypothetical protein